MRSPFPAPLLAWAANHGTSTRGHTTTRGSPSNSSRGDEVDHPAGPARHAAVRRQALRALPDLLELVTLVHGAHAVVAAGGRVVGDHVAGGGEADDHHDVARGPVAGAVE